MNARLPTFATEPQQHPIPDRTGTNAWLDDEEGQSLLPLYLPADLLAHLQPHLCRLGERAGGELDRLAYEADQNPPTLQHRSRAGLDDQRVLKHPSYVALEKVAFSDYGLAAMSHRAGVLGWPAPMPAAAKYALTYLLVQAEFGLCCPLSMTDSLTRTLRKYGDPELVRRYLADLTTQDLDALTQGSMFMTEQGAGSDVAATATMAIPDEQEPGRAWRLHGEKWFCSNPDAGLGMILARTQGAPEGMKGVSLFLVPKVLPDGTRNAYRIVRLKDKMGSRSMASGEIRFEGAKAWLVGELGRGFAQMADMVNNSRLSNGMRSAGMMRRAIAEALYIGRNRRAFGQRLIDMPLMQRQLAKIMLPAEQSRTMMFQTAEALRRSDAGEEGAYALTRLLTPLIKFRACRDARAATGDAMEVRGGCGYIEEWGDPRFVRDAHLGSIWEGTSNIVALDVIRAIRREASLPVWRAHVQALLAKSSWHAQPRAHVDALIERVESLAEKAAEKGQEALARQAATALYRLTAAIAMGWEASQTGSMRRMLLAQLAVRHQLLPADPLQGEAATNLSPLFEQAPPRGDVGVVNIFAD
ncbi:acyl-CoA dehydrogenase family protein [Ramlibacter alkalitolerans]|uniref:Acyl-CoA dehydrogenase family protein n=1 Tax=Ramlibacter alkalitolerans TaxID=2039631 RepID=A0ABS1JMC3_9BURK|nr:acyl-CoA dehydrogenase family protein [Ramlibacter alkalitolerans]MBL0424935.1 acyl-CoA dehydrogenase family protein [Ramlibacter alkalitolerans]